MPYCTELHDCCLSIRHTLLKLPSLCSRQIPCAKHFWEGSCYRLYAAVLPSCLPEAHRHALMSFMADQLVHMV